LELCGTFTNNKSKGKTQISTGLVTARLDTTRHVWRVEQVEKSVERVEPRCSNMADDEQARVLACTSLVG